MDSFHCDVDIDTAVASQINLKKHQFKWTFKNLTELPLIDQTRSPEFSFVPSCSFFIFIEIEDDDYFHFCLVSSPTNTNHPWKATYDFNILNINGDILKTCSSEICFPNQDHDLVPDGDGDTWILYSGYGENIIPNLADNVMILTCSFSVLEGIETKVLQFLPSSAEPDYRNNLVEDMKNMLKNAINTDVTFYIENQPVKAHWAVICARCPYFNGMFKSGMKEATENHITIPDVTLSAFRGLLEFIYTSESDLFNELNKMEKGNELDLFSMLEKVYELYIVADKYRVVDLQKKCANFMISRMSVDNVGKVLLWAEQHGDTCLKTSAMEFTKKKFKSVSQSSCWEALVEENPKLGAEAVLSFYKNN